MPIKSLVCVVLYYSSSSWRYVYRCICMYIYSTKIARVRSVHNFTCKMKIRTRVQMLQKVCQVRKRVKIFGHLLMTIDNRQTIGSAQNSSMPLYWKGIAVEHCNGGYNRCTFFKEAVFKRFHRILCCSKRWVWTLFEQMWWEKLLTCCRSGLRPATFYMYI